MCFRYQWTMMDKNKMLRIVMAFICWAFFTITSQLATRKFFDKVSDGLVWEKVLLVTSLQSGGGAILFFLLHDHCADQS
jgi:hypothetical protein